MNIRFFGNPRYIKKKEVEYALNFFANILLGPRLAKNVTVYVEYKDLTFGAEIIPIDYDERSRNHREFHMAIHKRMSYCDNLRVLSHEMTHLMQFARGDFTCVHTNIMYWKGLRYKLTDATYSYVPWEKEAKNSEGWLLWFYEQHHENNNLVF